MAEGTVKVFYPCEINVDHIPDHLSFPKFLLTGVLGNVEMEEAAARLLSFCQEEGKWCGVSWKHYGEAVMKTVDEGITDKIQSMAAVFARPDDILNGIANLEEKELIWIKKIDGVEVIFPTKDLVQAVVEAGFVKTD